MGLGDGASVGVALVGLALGLKGGLTDGDLVGRRVGDVLGLVEGRTVGTTLGQAVGFGEGLTVGLYVFVGPLVLG